MSASAGESLGKYTLVRKLAAGGMAEVFLARVEGPAGFEKMVVVKRILSHLAEDPSFISMFLSEAKLAAQLNHPNVVQVFDFGEQNGTWFLVMEPIDGLNLRSLFRKAAEKGEYLPVAVAMKLAVMALEGLAYAHEFTDPNTGEPLALVHRDVSPDNILVGRNGSVKVVDFGIAKAANQTHLTRTGNVKGKFAYMPPEQLQGQKLDARADLFAMGVVLYELLTSRKPFDVSNDAVVVRAILYETFSPLATYRPEAPPELQQILDRAFAKNVAERYPSARAMAADLERLLLKRGESVTPYELGQLVQRLAGPSNIAVAATPKPQPSISASAPTHVPQPAASAPQAATVPNDPPKPPPAPPPAPPPTGIAPTPASAVVDLVPSAVAPPVPSAPSSVPQAVPYQGSPSRPGVASPGGGAPSIEAIPVDREWTAAQASLPGWANQTLQGHAPAAAPQAKRTIAVVEEVPRRSPLTLAVAGLVAVAVGAAVMMGVMAMRPKPDTLTVVTPVVVEPPVAKPPEPPPEVKVDAPPEAKLEPTDTLDAGLAAVQEPVVPEPIAKVRPVVKPKQKPPEPPPPPSVSDELVDFRVRPFGTVSVDGKVLGDTPFPAIKLAVGAHRVQVVNKELNKSVQRTFEVKTGVTNVFRLNLEEESP